MSRIKITILTICIIFIVVGCIYESKPFKVIYKGNIPIGTFKATINNKVIFTNGPDIVEIYKNIPDIFCYETRERYFCENQIKITINENSSQRMSEITSDSEIIEIGGRLILLDKLKYYYYNKELSTLEIDSKLKGELINEIEIPVLGTGKTKKEAIKNAIKMSDELFNILSDLNGT